MAGLATLAQFPESGVVHALLGIDESLEVERHPRIVASPDHGRLHAPCHHGRMEPDLRTAPWRPTPAQLAAADGRAIADLVAPGLRMLFCGINPGRYSGATGRHFARPGNRFWPTLYAAGFTPRLLHPSEERDLLPLGYGVTNVVRRASATADVLTAEEIMDRSEERRVGKECRSRCSPYVYE